jgi:DNA-binding beta-propeller fold protein YncE
MTRMTRTTRIARTASRLTASFALLGAASALAGCPEPEAHRTCTPTAGTICTVAGSNRAGVSGDEGPGWAARLYLPMDSTVGPNGHLFIVDWNNHRLRELSDPLSDGRTTDTLLTTCAGTGTLGDGPAGPALMADFNHPTDIVFDAEGRLWIAAWHNSRIIRLDASISTMEQISGTGGRSYAGDDGPASSAVLDLPAGLELDREGNVFFVDQANQVIRRIDGETGTISRVAGMCLTNECPAGETPTQCPGGSGKWRCGTDMAACGLPCQPSYGGDGGPALEARFAFPFGQSADPAGRLAIAPDGTIYLADSRNHRIRRISPDGMVDTFAGTGTAGYSGDGGPADEAQLNNPVDVELTDDGMLYVTDTFNSCIRVIDPTGTIRTAVGQCGQRGFSGDGGPPTAALLDRPYGVEIDETSGAIYVTDTHNSRVRVVLP